MAKRRKNKKKRSKSAPPGKAGSPGGSAQSDGDRRRPPGHPDRTPKKEKGPKSATRSFIETIVTVVVLVVVLRMLLIEAFKIPSSSMEPALLGNPYHGDRVLAWKPSGYIGTPSRWSVFVFVKHPDRDELVSGETSDRNFIKRLVGLPGERILISGGDIFVRGQGDENFAIARKPERVQEGVWHTVYEAARDRWPVAEVGNGPARWELDAGLARDAETGAISGRAEGRAWARFAANHYDDDKGVISNLFLLPARLDVACPHCGERFEADISTGRTRFRCPSAECGRWLDILKDDLVVDDAGILECPRCKRYVGNRRKDLTTGKCPHCGFTFMPRKMGRILGVPGRFPPSRDAEEPVADIRVSLDIIAREARGRALIEIGLDDDRYLAEVPLAGGSARLTGPAWPGGIESEGPVAPFEPGVARGVSLAHVDQTVIMKIDGDTVFERNYDAGWDDRAGGPRANSVRVGLEDAEAMLGSLRIERDLHYLARGSPNVMRFWSGDRRRWEEEPGGRPFGLSALSRTSDAVMTRTELGQAEFLMLGDNSPSSDDGRRWGFVNKKDLVGRAFVLFWPPNRIRWLR